MLLLTTHLDLHKKFRTRKKEKKQTTERKKHGKEGIQNWKEKKQNKKKENKKKKQRNKFHLGVFQPVFLFFLSSCLFLFYLVIHKKQNPILFLLWNSLDVLLMQSPLLYDILFKSVSLVLCAFLFYYYFFDIFLSSILLYVFFSLTFFFSFSLSSFCSSLFSLFLIFSFYFPCPIFFYQ